MYIILYILRAFLEVVYDLSSPVVGSHLVGSRSAGCVSALESFSGLKGSSPQAFTPFERVIAWHLRHPDRAEGIFDLAERVWASALRPDPP